MRRPRAGLVSRFSGDAGLCPGALQTPRQELADAEPPRFARDMDPAATRKGSRSVPKAKRSGETQSADPASKENAANGAPRGARAVQKAARITQDWCASRRSIPLELPRGRNLPLRKRGMEGGLPGASNNTGDGARLYLSVVPAERSEGRDPYSAAYRKSTAYGSPPSRGRPHILSAEPFALHRRF